MRNPMTETSNNEMTRAIAVGIGSSIGLNLVYVGLLSALGNVDFILTIIAPLTIGYLVGEAVYRASGYIRNKNLAWVAAGSVIGGFAVLNVVLAGLDAVPKEQGLSIFGVLIGSYMAYTRIRP